MMADLGVDTIYIQTARFNHPDDVLDDKLLRAIIDEAHERGMNVVGWYLPTLEDPDTELGRLVAAGRAGRIPGAFPSGPGRTRVPPTRRSAGPCRRLGAG